MHRILALKFAAWLSPEFEVWVYTTIEEILFGEVKQLSLCLNDYKKVIKEKENVTTDFDTKILNTDYPKNSAERETLNQEIIKSKIRQNELSQSVMMGTLQSKMFSSALQEAMDEYQSLVKHISSCERQINSLNNQQALILQKSGLSNYFSQISEIKRKQSKINRNIKKL